MGVYCRKVLWSRRNAGGEHLFHGHRCFWRIAVCSPQIFRPGRAYTDCALFHRFAVPDYLRIGVAVFVVLVSTAFRNIRVFTVHHWELCGRSSRLRYIDPWSRTLDRHRISVSGAKFLGIERDQRSCPSADNWFAADLAGYVLRAVLRGHGTERSCAHFRAQEFEMTLENANRSWNQIG